MNRFLVFAGSDYDTELGWNCFAESAPTLARAREVLGRIRANTGEGTGGAYDWVQIVSLEEEEVVEFYRPQKQGDLWQWALVDTTFIPL